MRLAGRQAGRQACDEGVNSTASETEGSGGWSDHCEAFLCVADKSESFTSFSGDRFLLYDSYVWIGGDLNLIERLRSVLIVFRQQRTIYCYLGLHEWFRFLRNGDVSSTLFTICG
jgi:hypothetical protein